jgi:NitT/TauT family transport system substrate-binding protein
MTTPSLQTGQWPLLAVLLALLTLAGCLRAPEEPLRIGLNPWPGYDFLYLAAEKGWIEEAGGNVEIVAFTSLGDSRRAFERGQVDAFGGTTVELMLARQNADRQPRAFYVTNWSQGADQILAHPPIGSVPELKGERVGVEPASLDLLVLATALDRAGMAYDAVHRVSVPQADLPDALADGRIDAAVTYPPVSHLLKERFDLRPVFDTAAAPETVLDLFIAEADSLNRRPRDFVAIVRAFHRAVRFARDHPREAYRIMGRRERLSATEVAEILDGLRVLDLDDQAGVWRADGPVVRTLQRTGAILHEAGHLQQPPSPERLANPAIVEAAGGSR